MRQKKHCTVLTHKTTKNSAAYPRLTAAHTRRVRVGRVEVGVRVVGFVVEHGAHHLGFTHHLHEVLIVLPGVERAVLKLIYEVVGVFHALVCRIPGVRYLSSEGSAVEPPVAVVGGDVAGVHRHVHVAVEAERAEIVAAVGARAEQLGIHPVERAVDFSLVAENIPVVILGRRIHSQEVIARRECRKREARDNDILDFHISVI